MNSLKIRKLQHPERWLIFLVAACMFASIFLSGRLVQKENWTSLRKVNEGWYRYVGGQKYNVTLPSKITVPDGEDLTIYYDGLKKTEGSRTIFTKGAVYDITMRINNHTIYTYQERGFRRNAQMKAKLDCMGILPESPEGSTVSITYKNQGNNKFHLNSVFVGRSGEALRKIWYDNIFQMLGVFTLSIIGIVCFCAHCYLKSLHIDDSRMGSSAIFLLLCSTWCLLETSVVQQIRGAAPIMSVIAIYAFLCLPIPVIHFVKRTGDMAKYKAIDYLLYLTYGHILLQGLLHVAAGTDYVDMIPLTQLLHSVTCAAVHYMLFREYQENPSFEITAVLQGVTILGIAGVVELVLYWVLKTRFYGMALEIGVLAFIIRMLCAILSSMTANIRFKAEALVYKNMSREDRLTGLANRRAFDETMAELEQHAHRYQNVALFFMDVNGLKIMNDRYGHHAGDELIINAARCISNAFSEFGTCFRLGGDEFACIVTDPSFTQEDWETKINAALEQQNATSRWPVSVAWGVSYQRDKKRNVKRSTDWLYEADQTMYEMKMRMKATREDLSEEHK